MQTIAIIILLGLQGPEIELIAENKVREAGFGKTVTSKWRGYRGWMAKQGGATFRSSFQDALAPRTIGVSVTERRQATTRFVDFPPGISDPRGWSAGQVSGLRMGAVDFSCVTTAHVGVIAVSAFEYVSIDMHETAIPPSGLVGRDDLPLLEGLARIAMARAAGMRLDTSVTASYGGTSVPAFVCRFSGRRFVELVGWARAAGWTCTTNQEKTFATLTRSGTTVIVPLASQMIKVGEDWKGLPDMVAEKDGVWYVPEAMVTLISN